MLGYFTMMMETQTASGRVICWMIIIVMLLFFAMALSVASYYSSLGSKAKRMMAGKDLNARGNFFQDIQAAYENAIRKGVRDIGETGIIEDAVSSVIGCFEYVIKYLPSLVTILGLLGTFVGLTSAIGKMDFSAESILAVEDIVNKINAPIGDMSTAFYTSLVGIIGAVLMNLLERILRINQRGSMAYQNVRDYMNVEYLNAVLSAMTPAEKYQSMENDPASIAWSEASRRIAKALQSLKDSLDKMNDGIETMEQRGFLSLSNSIAQLIRVYQAEHDDVTSVNDSMKAYMTSLQGLGRALEQNSRIAGSNEALLEQMACTYKMLAEEHELFSRAFDSGQESEVLRLIREQIGALVARLENASLR